MKLHLGSGSKYIDGWINVDFLPSIKTDLCLDLAHNPLPYDDYSIEEIIMSHMIEHLNKQHGYNLLLECYRVLKIGGILSIVFPDIIQIVDHYKWIIQDDHWIIRAIFATQDTPDLIHRYGYTKDTMHELLCTIGFSDVKLIDKNTIRTINNTIIFEIRQLVTGFEAVK